MLRKTTIIIPFSLKRTIIILRSLVCTFIQRRAELAIIILHWARRTIIVLSSIKRAGNHYKFKAPILGAFYMLSCWPPTSSVYETFGRSLFLSISVHHYKRVHVVTKHSWIQDIWNRILFPFDFSLWLFICSLAAGLRKCSDIMMGMWRSDRLLGVGICPRCGALRGASFYPY